VTQWDIETLERGYVLASQDEYATEAPGNAECLAAFLEWLGADGADLTARWRAGEAIAEAETPYLWVAKAAWIWRGDRLLMRRRRGFDPADADQAACIDYVEKLEQRGRDAMIRGYFHEPLSDEDTDTLREYRILADTRILETPVWPYELGIGESSGPRGTPEKYFPLGGEVPDLKWPRMEAVLESPDYTDLPTRDPRAVMLPDAVEDFLVLFRGYETRQAPDGRRYVGAKRGQATFSPMPRQTPNPDARKSSLSPFRLRDFRGHKPVALLIASATDCFWARAVAHVQPLQRAYGDEVEFVWVNVRLWDFLIHALTTRNHYLPDVGLEVPPFQRTLEERARWAKKLYMTYPDLALPCVLDDPADTTASLFQEGGGSSTVILIDVDGRVAWHSAGWGWWNRTRPPGRTASDAWADALEREICTLLQRGGRYDPDHAPFHEPDRQIAEAPPEGARASYLAASRVTAVDPEARRLTLAARPVARFTVVNRPVDARDFYNDPEPIELAVPDDARLTVGNAPVPWDELQPGDVVSGRAWRLADGGWIAKDLHVQSRAAPDPVRSDAVRRSPPVADTCMTARVVSVQADEGTCTVQRLLPPPAEMKGYHFNRQAGEAIQLDGLARDNMETVSRWLADDDPLPRYTFAIGDDALVRFNGQPAALSDARVGDLAAIWYAHSDEDRPRIPAATLRISRRPT